MLKVTAVGPIWVQIPTVIVTALHQMCCLLRKKERVNNACMLQHSRLRL